jgi:hypothetical protein
VIAIVFRVGGTAIDATEIAAVGDRDAEVGDLAAETVVKGHLGWPMLDAFAEKNCSHPENKTTRIRRWNRALAGNRHISGKIAPFQTREARAFPPEP